MRSATKTTTARAATTMGRTMNTVLAMDIVPPCGHRASWWLIRWTSVDERLADGVSGAGETPWELPEKILGVPPTP